MTHRPGRGPRAAYRSGGTSRVRARGARPRGRPRRGPPRAWCRGSGRRRRRGCRSGRRSPANPGVSGRRWPGTGGRARARAGPSARAAAASSGAVPAARRSRRRRRARAPCARRPGRSAAARRARRRSGCSATAGSTEPSWAIRTAGVRIAVEVSRWSTSSNDSSPTSRSGSVWWRWTRDAQTFVRKVWASPASRSSALRSRRRPCCRSSRRRSPSASVPSASDPSPSVVSVESPSVESPSVPSASEPSVPSASLGVEDASGCSAGGHVVVVERLVRCRRHARNLPSVRGNSSTVLLLPNLAPVPGAGHTPTSGGRAGSLDESAPTTDRGGLGAGPAHRACRGCWRRGPRRSWW